jgi:hypothetical protein
VQFHIECDTAMIAGWVENSMALLDDLGYDAQELIDACDARMPDLEEVWRPFAQRFAAIALGTLTAGPGRELPILRG